MSRNLPAMDVLFMVAEQLIDKFDHAGESNPSTESKITPQSTEHAVELSTSANGIDVGSHCHLLL